MKNMSLLKIIEKPILLTLVGASLVFVSSCSESAVPPTAEQTVDLKKMIGACKTLEAKSRRLSHLAEYRKKHGVFFTCEDVDRACNSNYIGDECTSAKLIVTIETALEKKCRRSQSASASKTCRKLANACNLEGFQSDACLTAIAPYRP